MKPEALSFSKQNTLKIEDSINSSLGIEESQATMGGNLMNQTINQRDLSWKA